MSIWLANDGGVPARQVIQLCWRDFLIFVKGRVEVKERLLDEEDRISTFAAHRPSHPRGLPLGERVLNLTASWK